MNTSITKTFTYKLKPSKLVRHVFNQYAGSVRYTYNYMLALVKSNLETENKWLSYKHMASILPILKRQENTKWLKLIHSQVLQQALKNLENGINKYIRSRKNKQKAGFPLNTYLPSSKLCSACGNIQAMPLKLRVYKCSSCLVEIDRDLNASKNIRAAGISVLKGLWSEKHWLTQ